MKQQKGSFLPTILIAIALGFAVYFAVFGNPVPQEPVTVAEDPVAEVTPEPEPEREIIPDPEPEIIPEPDPDPGEIGLQDPVDPEWKELDELYAAGKLYECRPLIAKLFKAAETTDDQRKQLARQAIKLNQKLVLIDADKRDVTVHPVQNGEVLTTIARKYKHLHGEWGIVAVVNNLTDPGRLRVGKKLRIPKGPWSLHVDKSMFRMWLLYKGTPFKEYEIAIGKQDKTPAVTFKVSSKTPKPTWYPPAYLGIKDRTIRYGDPRNPLGQYWIAIDHPAFDGYGIHGTNDESVIGTAASNGCIRMHDYEINQMASIAYTGMEVRIVE